MLTNNKVIAKNTLFLYFRMLLIMFVSLYTSRVVLSTLGVDDFGIYATVGGIVMLLSFVNGAMSTGSSRFLTFALGKKDFIRLKKTFDTTLSSHIIISVIILIIAETIGLWFLLNKLVIPEERMYASIWVYQISILTAIINITQVPYTASIIAHEKMTIYAYVGIVEVLLKLTIVFFLTVCSFDKLITYAFLLCAVQISIAAFYRIYCVSKFKETKYTFSLDKEIFKEIFGFSGWSLFASGSIALNEQGTTLITNMFFGPSVVAARAISLQVNMAANQFVSNFRTAVNPQIVKKYASEDFVGSKSLLLSSTKYSFYLMFLLGFPIILLANPILNIWLVNVPDYTVAFVRLAIIQSLFAVFDSSFYTALYAKGRLRENALLSPTIGFIRFPIVYFLFKIGCSPLVLSYAGIVTYAILGLVVKPILIMKIVNYRRSEIFSVFLSCIKVLLVAIPVPLILSFYLEDSLINYFTICIVAIISVLLSIYCFGIDRQIKNFINLYITNLISRIKHNKNN